MTVRELITQIEISCDGDDKQPWQKALVLHLVRAGAPFNPTCALVMVSGMSHEQADEALADMNRYLLNTIVQQKKEVLN